MNPVRPRRPRRRTRTERTAVGRCTSGKRRYPDAETAYCAALRISVRVGKPVRAYLCPHCEGWHLTRRPTWKDPT